MKKLSLILSLLLISTNLSLIGCSIKSRAENGIKKQEKKLTNVKVMIVKPEPFESYINLVGTVKPNSDVMVSALEGGRIEKIFVERGSIVSSGSVIAELEKDILEASYNLALAQYNLAMVNYNSAKELYENNGDISEKNYLSAKYNAEMASAQKDIAKKRLDNATVKSPTFGIVVQRFVDPGEMTGPGTPIVQVLDLSKVKIETGIPENEISYFKKGTNVQITFDAYPNAVFTGTIHYISPAVDPQNRTFTAEIILDNSKGLIKSEMVAKLRLLKSKYESALIIPQDAIVETELGKVIYVLRGGNVAEMRKIKVGPIQGNKILIEEGIKEGEKLIVVGQQDIENGEVVNVVE